MEKLTRIKMFSFAKFQAIVMALVGLLAGILYSFGGFIIDVLVSFKLLNSSQTDGLSYGTVLAFGAVIGMPVLFAMLGYILGLMEAILFNIFSSRFGGINIDFKQ